MIHLVNNGPFELGKRLGRTEAVQIRSQPGPGILDLKLQSIELAVTHIGCPLPGTELGGAEPEDEAFPLCFSTLPDMRDVKASAASRAISFIPSGVSPRSTALCLRCSPASLADCTTFSPMSRAASVSASRAGPRVRSSTRVDGKRAATAAPAAIPSRATASGCSRITIPALD